jgi:hypothetical protein
LTGAVAIFVTLAAGTGFTGVVFAGVLAATGPEQAFLHCIHLGMQTLCPFAPFALLQALYVVLQSAEHVDADAGAAPANRTAADSAATAR